MDDGHLDAPAQEPVFARLLGPAYAELPDAVRRFHERGDAHYAGHAVVHGVDHALARLIRHAFGFPRPSGQVPIRIHVQRRQDHERWSRRFGDRAFASSFRCDDTDGLLAERFGPFRFHFALTVGEGGMHWHFMRWSLGRLPLPRVLGPRIESWETQDETGAFRFYSHADFPLLGRLIHYDGRVVPIA